MPATPTSSTASSLGQIQPMNLGGGLQWMGITPEVMGDDAYAYRWAADYAQPQRKAA